MCQPQMCSAARNAAAETYRTLRPWGQPVCKQQEKDTYVATTPPAFDGSLQGWPLEQLLSLHREETPKEHERTHAHSNHRRLLHPPHYHATSKFRMTMSGGNRSSLRCQHPLWPTRPIVIHDRLGQPKFTWGISRSDYTHGPRVWATKPLC